MSNHWVLQRITGLLLIPLGLWFVFTIKFHGVNGLLGQLSNPYTLFLMMAWMLVAFYHAHLGLQTIIEDYFPNKKARFFTLWMVRLSILISGLLSFILILFAGLKENDTQINAPHTIQNVQEVDYELIIQ
jgi:succinate dehydrogenase / fumarate reductase membrane anchor subunit